MFKQMYTEEEIKAIAGGSTPTEENHLYLHQFAKNGESGFKKIIINLFSTSPTRLPFNDYYRPTYYMIDYTILPTLPSSMFPIMTWSTSNKSLSLNYYVQSLTDGVLSYQSISSFIQPTTIDKKLGLFYNSNLLKGEGNLI